MTKNCGNCVLRAVKWPGAGIASATGFCIWFLKKLAVPRPIPANVVDVGCKNWKAGNSYKEA